ncbi:unnamed protein product [Phytophthora fragariaefolia]|uniref:Unnamed protein product n=1 Tax=Phytophthora fragariaefolia TaxID=1490495 RepID=A0A9W6Y1F1_9STRA|nr:unnamed protein product [Phytophthora fragariaefolia]
MESRRQAAQRQLALANGPAHPTDERIEHVEATMAEMDERIGQVNHCLDRILEGTDALMQTVATTQESTRQNIVAMG